ncbi:MAG: DUF6339 family protein [Acidimicrobiaceae bacterium]|nr:DUF6339 family protein [Acidimicrobiaceae bacterium]
MNETFDHAKVRVLTDTGYGLLHHFARDAPHLLRDGNPETLWEEMQRRHAETSSDPDSPLFSQRYWDINPSQPLSSLIEDAVRGPGKDEDHAKQLCDALPEVTAADMADQRVLASINCFHLADYPDVRWQNSNLWSSTDPDKQIRFVVNHWLSDDSGFRESNTAARLWWLHYFARQASQHSEHSTNELLHEMANNINFYHPLLEYPYLMASDRIRAAILDVSIRCGLPARNRDSDTRNMLRALNLRAGAISLDILSDTELRKIVEEAMPS